MYAGAVEAPVFLYNYQNLAILGKELEKNTTSKNTPPSSKDRKYEKIRPNAILNIQNNQMPKRKA